MKFLSRIKLISESFACIKFKSIVLSYSMSTFIRIFRAEEIQLVAKVGTFVFLRWKLFFFNFGRKKDCSAGNLIVVRKIGNWQVVYDRFCNKGKIWNFNQSWKLRFTALLQKSSRG